MGESKRRHGLRQHDLPDGRRAFGTSRSEFDYLIEGAEVNSALVRTPAGGFDTDKLLYAFRRADVFTVTWDDRALKNGRALQVLKMPAADEGGGEYRFFAIKVENAFEARLVALSVQAANQRPA